VKGALVLFGLCAIAVAQESGVAADSAAFVEISAPRESFFAGEAIPIVLRIAFESRFFRTHAIQETRQQLDVPVQVEAAFLREQPGAAVLADPASDPRSAGARLSFALNGGLAHGRKGPIARSRACRSRSSRSSGASSPIARASSWSRDRCCVSRTRRGSRRTS
jgi:hypothetical protein